MLGSAAYPPPKTFQFLPCKIYRLTLFRTRKYQWLGKGQGSGQETLWHGRPGLPRVFTYPQVSRKTSKQETDQAALALRWSAITPGSLSNPKPLLGGGKGGKAGTVRAGRAPEGC
jgi:hypothetical protein